MIIKEESRTKNIASDMVEQGQKKKMAAARKAINYVTMVITCKQKRDPPQKKYIYIYKKKN